MTKQGSRNGISVKFLLGGKVKAVNADSVTFSLVVEEPKVVHNGSVMNEYGYGDNTPKKKKKKKLLTPFPNRIGVWGWNSGFRKIPW